MQKEILDYYHALRQMFGVCPCCGELFRASDCKIYRKDKPITDQKEKIDREVERLDRLEEQLSDRIAKAREKHREAGRRDADKLVKRIDPIFRPMRLNPNDAKVIFHPIDFIVFNGMNRATDPEVNNIVLLDKQRTCESKDIQRSIAKAIEKEQYEWLTLRVKEDGGVEEE